MASPADPFEGFTLDQARRVAALNAAREVLATGGINGKHVDAIDLFNLATYIEHGIDPWSIGRPVETAFEEAK